jgi:predicted Rossmann-fold nucleotide-binding protein
MESAATGARKEGGHTIGIIPARIGALQTGISNSRSRPASARLATR